LVIANRPSPQAGEPLVVRGSLHSGQFATISGGARVYRIA
jgi:hypothetical protein